MYNLPENSLLYADSNRGVYIPQHFAESVVRDAVRGVSERDWRTLEAGPDEEWYWETWNRVEQNAILTEPGTGIEFYLYQDGDLWLIPVDAEWPDPEFAEPKDVFIP